MSPEPFVSRAKAAYPFGFLSRRYGDENEFNPDMFPVLLYPSCNRTPVFKWLIKVNHLTVVLLAKSTNHNIDYNNSNQFK